MEYQETNTHQVNMALRFDFNIVHFLSFVNLPNFLFTKVVCPSFFIVFPNMLNLFYSRNSHQYDTQGFEQIIDKLHTQNMSVLFLSVFKTAFIGKLSKLLFRLGKTTTMDCPKLLSRFGHNQQLGRSNMEFCETSIIWTFYDEFILPLVSVGPNGADVQMKKGFIFADAVSGKHILNLDHNTLLKKEGQFIGDSLKANSIRTPRVSVFLYINIIIFVTRTTKSENSSQC